MALAGTVDVAASSFVCSDVVIRGTVAIGENVLIHPGVVLDASDGGRIHIQEGCIIDDCVFISAGADGVCSVGPNTRIRSMASLRNVKLVRLEEVSCDDFCVLPAGAYVDEGDALPARTVVIGATNERRTQDAEAIEAAEVALEQLRRTTKKIFDAEQRRWAAPE